MTVSGMVWLALVAAVVVPAVAAAMVSRRRLVPLLLAWFVSPVFVYVGTIAWEMLTHPGVEYKPGVALYGFMLISPVLAPPWAMACLLGFGLGCGMRAVLRRRPDQVQPKRPAVIAPPPAPPPVAATDPGWRPVHLGVENDAFGIGGLDVWKHRWREEDGPRVRLPHPTHPTQMHDYEVFAIGDPATPVRFAACELSNGVWGFSIRRDDPVEAQGASQDGTLLYQHRLGSLQDPASPIAVLIDAGSGRVLVDGALWDTSRIVPNADGTLFLRLRQNGFDVLFRIDPAARQFWDHAEAGPRHPLAALSSVAEQARYAILDAKGPFAYRDISPNGTIRVDLATAEWSNTHWVNTPRVVSLLTGRVMLDLWGTDWDATVAFVRTARVRLGLRRYRQPGHLVLEIDVARETFRIDPPAGPESDGPGQPLDGMASALEAASAQWASTDGSVDRSAPSPWAAWRAALLILAGAIAAIAAGTALSLHDGRHQARPTAPLAKLPDFELLRPR